MVHKVAKIITAVLLVQSVLLFFGCASHQTGESPAASLVRQGEKLLDDGKYKASIPLFRKAVGLEPQNASAYRGLGLAYRGTGDLYRAEIFMRKALQLNKNMSDLWGYLGDIYLQKGDEKRAMSFFERCPPEDPHYAELHLRLGKMKLHEGQLDLADMEFTKALTHAEFWGGYWGKGYLAQLAGKWNEALNWYRQAHNRAQKPEILLGLAESYDTLKHIEPAFFYYTLYLGTEMSRKDRKNIERKILRLEQLAKIPADSVEHKLQFSIDANTNVSAGVFTKNGQIIKMLFSGMLSKGQYHLEWDGSDESGKPVDNGEYIGFVVAGEKYELHRFLVK